MRGMRRQRQAFRIPQSAVVTWTALFILLLVTTTGGAMEVGSFDLSLRSSTQFRYAWSDDPAPGTAAMDDNDQDFSQHLGLDVSWKEKGLTLSAMGRYLKDLDGTPEGSIYQDYTDTYAHRQDFEAYYMYLEKKDLITDGLNVRAGRQYSYGAETVHFDGLHVSYEQPDWAGLVVEGFGGRLVQHYTDLTRDEVGGYNLAIHPFSRLALTLDGVFADNNSTEGGLYWQPLETIQVNARLAFIDDESRFYDVNTQFLIPSTETVINAAIYHRYAVDLESDYLFDYTYTLENALSTKLTSLYLMQEKPYTEYDFRVSQPIPQSKGLTVYARYTNRVMSNNREDLYNTDFERVSTGITLEDWMGLEGFHLNAGYSFWKEDRSVFYEGKSSSYYADLRQELADFEIGLAFYHKTEDVNSRIEDEASTRYQASLKYHYMDHSWLGLLYQYDEDDFFDDELGVSSINTLTFTLHQEF